jgi:L-fucose isomerase
MTCARRWRRSSGATRTDRRIREETVEPLKAGYVSFGTQYYEPKNLAAISGRAEAQLAKADIELVRTDPVFGEGAEPERAIRELSVGGFDFLFANVVNWIEVRGVMRVLLAFRHLPVLLYSLGGFTENGTLICPAAGAGVAAIRWPLERMGFRFRHLFNGPDQPMDIPGILAFARAARAERLLKRTRLGMIGWNDMGLLSTDFSVVKLRDRIGCEVESVDLLQLERRMQALEAGRVAAETKRITASWEYLGAGTPQGGADKDVGSRPLAKPSPEAVERVMRLYLATVDLCREKGFAGFSYKCVDGVDRELGLTHAVPSSLVASAGYPYIDENDVGNLVAEMMLHDVSGQPVMFLEHYDHHPEWILLGEDGYIPDAFIEGKPQIKSVSTAPLGGLAHCSKLKTGRMTLACLGEDGAGYRMHIVTGEGRTPPQWVEMGVSLPSWPSVKFHPDVPVRRILDHVQSQHFAMTWGDWTPELVDLCRLLGITAIVDGK